MTPSATAPTWPARSPQTTEQRRRHGWDRLRREDHAAAGARRKGSGDSAAIARAIRWAARYGADVINLSLEFPAEVRAAEIPDVIAALRYARRQGSLSWAPPATRPTPRWPIPRAPHRCWRSAPPPITGCQADYSNSGATSTWWPRAAAPTPRTRTASGTAALRPRRLRPADLPADLRDEGVRRFGLPGGYEGTSMAAPHVSAIAALIIATGGSGRTRRRRPSRLTSRRPPARPRPPGRPLRGGAWSTPARRSDDTAPRPGPPWHRRARFTSS